MWVHCYPKSLLKLTKLFEQPWILGMPNSHVGGVTPDDESRYFHGNWSLHLTVLRTAGERSRYAATISKHPGYHLENESNRFSRKWLPFLFLLA